jgi:hypothetical protein
MVLALSHTLQATDRMTCVSARIDPETSGGDPGALERAER